MINKTHSAYCHSFCERNSTCPTQW